MTDNAIGHSSPDVSNPAVRKSDFEKLKEVALGDNALTKGLKLIGEVAITPGISLLLDGKMKSGVVHVGVGFIARRVFGLPGLLLVGADSYSQSVTGKTLLEHVQTLGGAGAGAGAGTAAVARDESLGQRVSKAINENKSLGEILATVAEDVEDKYHSLTSKT